MESRHLANYVALFILVSCLRRVDATPPTYTHYRLPASIQPDHYDLKIITHLENPDNFSFNGQVSIHFQALMDTNNITLHVKNLTIDESSIQLQSHDDDELRLCREGIATIPQHDYYIVRLCQTLLKGQMYNIKLDFSGILKEDLDGYYRRSYVDEATNETRWLSVTQFEPTSARSAFPCFDEPNYKAKFTIRLGHHKTLTALSNMPLEKQIPLAELDDFVWSIFEESVPMSTYLVAYTLNDFAYKESQVEGSDVVFRTWCRGDYIDQCGYAAEVAPQILQYYEQMLDIPYPLKKLDAIAIPNVFGGCLENWGLVTYPESALLIAANVSSPSKKMHITNVIAHELAHQWFGNLVTMKWWTDLWLNEGFATYIGSLGTDSLSPEWDTYNTDSVLNSLHIFSIDVQLNSHPISQAILNTNQIMKHFDAIAYMKGSAVLRMTHLLLGHDGFFEAVNGYLAKHKFQNAEQDDVWASFTEKAHKFKRIKPQHDMKTILDSWTLQKGYPLVKVSRNYETGSIEISQRIFIENSITSTKDANGCWWIPLSYTTESVLDFNTTTPKAWLECDDSGKSVALKLDNVTDRNEWIIFNIQLSGVYRVMYDTHNWKLLEQTLNSDKFTDIHVMNRAHIIFDVISFARNGYLDYRIAFDILEYLTREREYLPWQSAAEDIDNMFFLLQHFPQHQAYFKAYARHIVEPIYCHIGGLNDQGEIKLTHAQLSLKKLVTNWACLAELDHCVRAATDYFQQWKISTTPDKENVIPVDFRDIVYCTAIRHGNKDDWTFLWKRYKALQVDAEKSNIIRALGCSRLAAVLKDYIDLIFNKDEHLRDGDVSYAVDAIASNHISLPIALEYYAEHISKLDDDGFDVTHLAVLLSKHIVCAESLTKLNETLNEHFKESKKSVSIARTAMYLSHQWIECRLEDVKSQLQNRLSLTDIE